MKKYKTKVQIGIIPMNTEGGYGDNDARWHFGFKDCWYEVEDPENYPDLFEEIREPKWTDEDMIEMGETTMRAFFFLSKENRMQKANFSNIIENCLQEINRK